MITYKKVDPTFFPQYDLIPMRVHVSSCYRIDKLNRGLGGFYLVETQTEPYIKDFCTGDDESVERWKRWDISNWAFFMAFDNERPIGGATIASRTKEVNMLSDRDDLAVLWDIRIDDEYKHRGIGQTLFDMAVNWSREQGLMQMKIECQNNNIPAVKFYHKQGAVLSAVDEHAYYNEPEYRHETQFIWFVDLHEKVKKISDVPAMPQFVVEKEPCHDTIKRFVSVIRAYEGEYFTDGFADSVAVDAPYQRLCYLRNGGELLSGIMCTCLDGCPHITAMATKRENKNKGYGKQLMEYFIHYVSQLGFHDVELYAWSEKTKPVCASTQAFYKSVGFIVTSEHMGLWKRDMITVKMKKSW